MRTRSRRRLSRRLREITRPIFVCLQKTRARLARPKTNKIYFRASKIRLNGVSAVRRKSLKPPLNTVSRRAASVATAPNAGPFEASELDVQHKVEAPANVRPIGLKFSSTLLPAIGSTINSEPLEARTSAARLHAPTGSPMSCKQSKKVIKSY